MRKKPHISSSLKSSQSELLNLDRERRRQRLELASADQTKPRVRNDLLPELRLVDWPLASIRLPDRNVRSVTPGHVREVANAISQLGFSVPLLIDQDGMLLDGVARYEAAKLLGLSSAPCIVAGHLSPAERKLIRIAINRLGEKGRWDFGELKLEIEELIIHDMPIAIAGFDDAEMDGILAFEQEPVERGELVPQGGGPAIAKPGDVFTCGPHRIACGDAKDPILMRRLMGTGSARIVLTDQPYNVAVEGHVTRGNHREFAEASGEMNDAQFLEFNRAWLANALPYLVDGGIFGTFIDWRGLGSVSDAAFAAGLAQINLIVWAKTNAGMGSLYRSQHELLPLYKKGNGAHINNVGLGQKGRWRSNLWTYPGASSLGSDARLGLRHHPTVKPAAMIADALYDLTARGEIVLDPFLGSGSTLIAAHQTGRVCRGIDIDPHYVDLAVKRLADESGEEAVLQEIEPPPSPAQIRPRRRRRSPSDHSSDAIEGRSISASV